MSRGQHAGGALAFLYRFADMERGVGWNPRSAASPAWNRGRTRALLDLGGSPDRRLLVVLIAGTNGKGSTAALLARILHDAGIRAGLYTQPHLQRFHERIRVDGIAISGQALAGQVRRYRRYVTRLRRGQPRAGEPTTFELTTAIALDHFARRGCRVAVVEVGLGGRLDATNALDPAISIITPIGRDHTAILGATLGAIAKEKAGIMRHDRPALSAVQRPSALSALRRAAAGTRARLRIVDPLPPSAAVGPPGAHQHQNAALASEAARELRHFGLDIGERSIRTGLRGARWPGRYERIAGRPAVLLDGAHNGPGADALADALRRDLRGRPLQLVIGMFADKDKRAIVRRLLPLAERVWVTQPRGARSLPAADLAATCAGLTDRPIETCASVAVALHRARRHDATVLVAGSLALVGEAREALGMPWPRALWDDRRHS